MMRSTLLALAAVLALGGGAQAQSPSAFANPLDGNIPDAATHPRAVPTALGFGKTASVRDPNAVVYNITTGSDIVNEFDSEVSFRECVEGRKQAQIGNAGIGSIRQQAVTVEGLPRYCMFSDFYGYINLASPLVATYPKLFIAGSTAPQDGVEVTYAGSGYAGPAGTTCGGTNALLEIATHDVIVTHMRFRGKPHTGANCSDNSDAIRINKGAERVFLDHLSLAYTTDEVLDIYSGRDVSVTNSIIGPPLCGPIVASGRSSVGHSEAYHCRPNFSLGAKNVTYAYNLVVYGEQRGFNFSAGQRDINENPLAGQWGQIDVINNVSYYFREEHGLVSNRFGHTFANFINNTMWNGPQYDPAKAYPIGLYNKDPSSVGGSNTTGFAVYHSGNRTFRTTVASLQGQPGGINFCGITPGSNPPTVDCTITGLGVVSTTTPAVAPDNSGLSLDAADISSAVLAEKTVITFAGANRCQNTATGISPKNCRNEIDTAIVTDYTTCNAPPKKFSTANGGTVPWPASRANAFGNDTFAAVGTGNDDDGDGIPDYYEQTVGGAFMVPGVYDPNRDDDGDGYPNIEEYIADMSSADVWYNIHRTGFASPLTPPPNNCGYAINP